MVVFEASSPASLACTDKRQTSEGLSQKQTNEQTRKCLLSNHMFGCSAHHKKAKCSCTYLGSQYRTERQVPEAYWPASQATLETSRFSEEVTDPASKYKERETEEST